MIRARLFVVPVYVMFLSLIMAVSSGCACHVEVNNLPSPTPSVIVPAEDATPGPSTDTSSTPVLPDEPVADANTSEPDAVASPDVTSRADASVDTVDRADATSEEPVPTAMGAMVISSARCRDGAMHLPATMFGPQVTVWHLCYTTPAPVMGAADRSRPLAITFTRRNLATGEAVPLIRIEAPRTANPWTASAAIALRAPDELPLFNAILEYAPENRPQAVSVQGSALAEIGALRLWSVQEAGEKTSFTPRLLADQCLNEPEVSTHAPQGDWFPSGLDCPSLNLGRCLPGPFHCVRP